MVRSIALAAEELATSLINQQVAAATRTLASSTKTPTLHIDAVLCALSNKKGQLESIRHTGAEKRKKRKKKKKNRKAIRKALKKQASGVQRSFESSELESVLESGANCVPALVLQVAKERIFLLSEQNIKRKQKRKGKQKFLNREGVAIAGSPTVSGELNGNSENLRRSSRRRKISHKVQ